MTERELCEAAIKACERELSCPHPLLTLEEIDRFRLLENRLKEEKLRLADLTGPLRYIPGV